MCPMKVNSNTVELTVYTSCYFVKTISIGRFYKWFCALTPNIAPCAQLLRSFFWRKCWAQGAKDQPRAQNSLWNLPLVTYIFYPKFRKIYQSWNPILNVPVYQKLFPKYYAEIFFLGEEKKFCSTLQKQKLTKKIPVKLYLKLFKI